jgi:hypothetical protein
MSLSFELIFDCVLFFATTFKLEQRVSLNPSKDAPYSGATKGMMPSCPHCFFNVFKKIPTTLSRPIAQVKGF